MAENAGLISSHTDLQTGLGRLLTQPGPHYVVFTSDLDAGTERYWCPDCVRALPAIKQAMKAKGASLLEVRVGPRAVWKDASHPLRHDPAWAVTGVPTLVAYTAAGPGPRLARELEDAATAEEVQRLTVAFIQSGLQ